MAIKASYTLDDLTTYARDNFPLAFEIVSDPSVYKFESCRFYIDTGDIKEGELLHFFFWNGSHHGIPVWAFLNGDKVQYFYGKVGNTMTSAPIPYPSSGQSPIRGYSVPFSFVAVRAWPSSKFKAFVQMRVLTRKRLTLLIKFVFLLTGRITAIKNGEIEDLLIKFKDLCMHMQQNKVAGEEDERRKKEEQQREREKRREWEAHEARALNDPQAQVKEESVETASVPFRGSKRVAVDPGHDATEMHAHRKTSCVHSITMTC